MKQSMKRWFPVLLLGLSLFLLSIVQLLLIWPRLLDSLALPFLPASLRVLIPALAGGTLIWLAARRIRPLSPLLSERLPEDFQTPLVDHSSVDREPHIVAIGGGTGMPSLLRGLTPHTSNITAIVTVADDGGSSGRLRKELGLLPPGDFRNNLAALARDEALMTQVLQYRFGGLPGQNGQGELQGHAFGNLLLAALTGITGSFDEALLAAQEVLALRGQVLPSTLDNVTLVAEVEMPAQPAVRHRVVGESAISSAGGLIKQIVLEPSQARAYPPALRAIFQADLLILGPGSLYTSILPNLLVTDLAEALIHARGRVVYVCNIAMQPGETDGYTVADHVHAILQHVPAGVLDLVLANDNLAIQPDTGLGITRFVLPVPPDTVPMKTMDLVDESRPWRHDSVKLGKAILEILHELE
jgi:uncharacterized cofD-like protein